ncbi:MAG: hypothetical protein IT347_10830 [Candidatus Eisenbacteria bacterium]|nr:hypothetical protein [Candidatus Eisenbacteria bacterium]
MRTGAPVLALLAVLAAAAHGAELSDPSCGVTPFAGSLTQARFRLPRTFLRAGSDSAWTRTRGWVRGRDYAVDLLRGEVRLLSPLAPGETLWVAACGLLAPPPLEYAPLALRAVPAEAPPESSETDTAAAPVARPSTAREVALAPLGASLAVTGNKTVAVDFGSSQDAALRQSLDLAVSGRVAPGVELTGVLSDRNTPLTSGGATQDLQSLDRVLVELKSKQARAALGDIPLAFALGSFARLDRRVQGVRGDWLGPGFEASAAAASAQGEYRRLQFAGVDGLQGPYLLTNSAGETGAGVVAGSEIVTVDGQRMSRGESADYSMDYERGRVTFTNRRPISSASRITVEYQAAATRYRRNVAAASTAWGRGPVKLFAAAFSEGDDRGRPLDVAFDAADRQALAAAGDSAARAVGVAVVAGVGEYDSVRVAPDTLVYAWAGPDSGQFSVRFTRTDAGRGDYADSAIVAGRTAYRWVGPGRGDFVVGRSLPLPETHQLLSVGGSAKLGAVTLEAEAAGSKLDRNAFSSLDDGDNTGGAARLALGLEGEAPGLPGRAGLSLGARSVEKRFAAFSRLERPYAEEDWGLPAGADLDHQRRADAAGWWQPRAGDQLRADWSRLTTPDGYSGVRRSAEWTGGGVLTTRALLLDARGGQSGRRFGDAGRRRLLAEVRRAGALVAPSLRFERDDRRTPGDSASVRYRTDELTADLASGSRPPFRLAAGFTRRRDRTDTGASRADSRATTLRLAGESPAGAPLGIALSAQRRDVRESSSGRRTRADLASVRLHGEHRPTGLSGHFDVEVTGEAENKRTRVLTYAGPGLGSYDALGNFTGTGDYELVLAVSPELDRFTRVASSARARWDFGGSAAWRGSRVEFSLEDEARRRGALRMADAVLSTGLALVDPGLARGTIVQRLEGDFAPGSRAAAVRLRAERRVTADRTYENFAQLSDLRSGSLRWRARPGATATLEAELRAQWQRASQVAPASRYDRTLVDDAVSARCEWQPRTGVRAAAAADLTFSGPLGQREATRTIRLGPDVGVPVGARGRAELTVRRAFVSGPPALTLLPGVDPAGAPRWDGTARFDLRLHETTTLGLTAAVRDFPGRPTTTTGRAEVRAFF